MEEEKNLSGEISALKSELSEVVRECNLSADASFCLLHMITAGEMDVAFETLEANMSEYDSHEFSGDLRERLVAIRRRLDRLPSKNR